MKTTASLFTGGGGFEQGAMMAGYTPVWGVEIRPDIAEWSERNTSGLKVIVSDVAAVDYSALPKVDHLHASPSCKKASIANSDGGESPEDIEAARAVCRAIEAIEPDSFTLENVWQYREFEAFKLIVGQLVTLGYKLDWWHLNSADYGVPQTRKRLILIARKDHQPRRPQPTHSNTPDLFGVYKPWVGWYEAIADLVDSLPGSEFAPWQMERLPAELRTLLINGAGNTNFTEAKPGKGCRYESDPAQTVTTVTKDGGQLPKAFLLNKSADKFGDGIANGESRAFTVVSNSQGRYKAFLTSDNYGSPNNNGQERILQLYSPDDPAMTVTAQAKRLMKAGLMGRVVKMTPRALARFQSFPDSYLLPDSNGLACEIVGNAVPPLLAKAICESLGS